MWRIINEVELKKDWTQTEHYPGYLRYRHTKSAYLWIPAMNPILGVEISDASAHNISTLCVTIAQVPELCNLGANNSCSLCEEMIIEEPDIEF